MKERTIYTIMNEISTLRIYVTCAYKAYRDQEKGSYYYIIEGQAEASLATLLNAKYINRNEYMDMSKQLHHIFKMYKKNKKRT